MGIRHIDRALTDLLAPHIKSGLLELENGGTHAKVRHCGTRDFLALAGSPRGGKRVVRNFEAALNRLVERGEGIIFMKTGRPPLTM